MKNLLFALTVVLASCASVDSGNVPMAEGPVARTISRILDRVELYAAEDGLELTHAQLESISTSRALLVAPQANAISLSLKLEPAMVLHDELVMDRWKDERLDELEVSIFLQDTMRMRSLLQSVQAAVLTPEETSQPVPAI